MNTENVTLSDSEKIAFISSFSTMLSAGISILELVNSLLEDAKGNQRKILEVLKDDLTQGKRINTTFAKFPGVFDKVTVNIIKASEEAGTLEITLKDLQLNITKDIEFKDKIKSALAYPVLIFFVFTGVMLLLLIFIIPRISEVFLRMKVALPLPTRIMISVSNLLVHNTIPVILVLFLISASFYYFYKRKKRLILNFLFSLPLIKNLAKNIDLTVFARSIALLLNAGLPIIAALDLTREVTIKKEVSNAINHSKEMILAGKKLSDGFKDRKDVFPTIMIKIVEAGEKSGSLEKSMQDLSVYLDYQVSKTLKSVTTLIEPIMLVVVGLLIGGMMLSIIAPIYGMIGQVGGH